MRYEYRCQVCGAVFRSNERASKSFCQCGGVAQRLWGFQMTPVMHHHHNSVTGSVISDRNQFKSELKRKSDEATERTGIPHNYVPADMSDTKSLRVTDDGLRETYDRQIRTGEREKGAKSWL